MRLPAILTLFYAMGIHSIAPAHGAGANPTTRPVETAAPLVFDATRFEARELKVDGKTVAVRAYENIVYVAKPVDMSHPAHEHLRA